MFKHALRTMVMAVGGISTAFASSFTPLTTEDFAQQAEDFVLEQALSYPGQARVIVHPPDISRMPACAQSEAFLPSSGRLRPRMTVGFRCLAPSSWTSYTQVELSIEGQYYVSSRSLDSGTIIADDDIATRDGDLLRLAPGTVFDRDRLLGSITTQRIGTGSPIRERALRSADSIARGQAVRLEARGVGFVATSEGTAMQSGEPGTQIQVKAASGQLVSGTVLNSQTVLVLM